jgi:hypothetical protein
MKTQRKSKNSSTRARAKKLTLGELIAATYNACGPQGAPKLLKLAIESHMVRFAPRPVF